MEDHAHISASVVPVCKTWKQSDLVTLQKSVNDLHPPRKSLVKNRYLKASLHRMRGTMEKVETGAPPGGLTDLFMASAPSFMKIKSY